MDSMDSRSSVGQDESSGSSSAADISDGAKRLAQELDHYIASGVEKKWGDGNSDNGSALSDDAVADLQLTTARKLREVCLFVLSFPITSVFSYLVRDRF